MGTSATPMHLMILGYLLFLTFTGVDIGSPLDGMVLRLSATALLLYVASIVVVHKLTLVIEIYPPPPPNLAPAA